MFNLYFEDDYVNRQHVMCGEREEIFDFIHDFLCVVSKCVVPCCHIWTEGDETRINFGSNCKFFIIMEEVADVEIC